MEDYGRAGKKDETTGIDLVKRAASDNIKQYKNESGDI